jgi:hypothetical protein
MNKNGLVETIRAFSESADELVSTGEVTNGLARSIMIDVANHGILPGVPYDSSKSIGFNDTATTLFLFRYPKRFSPLQTDLLAKETVKKFISTQNRMKLLQRREYNRYIIGYLQEEIAEMINWDALCDEIDAIEVSDIVFTPGVGFDSSASLYSKLEALTRSKIEYFYQPFGVPMVSQPEDAQTERFWGFGYTCHEYHRMFPKHVVRLATVPKNYKSNRVIAPEDTYRQAYARRMFQIGDRYLPSDIDLHDQSRNQTLAKLGSCTGSLATLDLSSASDTVSRTLVYEIFPIRFVRILDRILPTHYTYDGGERLLYAAATMGNSMTFWLESVVFYAIAKVACKMSGVEGEVSVYGDDIILPTSASITCIELLEKLGFIVNEDKSFFSETLLYRESCGEEYLNGTNVSSLYFPRFPLEGSLNGKAVLSKRSRRDSFNGVEVSTLTALIDLQHKMFKTCLPAAMFLRELILESNPRITTSVPDMEQGDIWGYEPLPKYKGAPIADIDSETGKWSLGWSDEHIRELYSVAVSTYVASEKVLAKKNETLYTLYKYQHFLKHGPRFDDELSRLLNVSTPFPPFSEVCSQAEIEWRYKPL